MKKLLLLPCLCIVISFTSFAQITYLIDTAFTTDIGFGGAPASCIFTGGNDFGFQMYRPQGTWLADVFTVPAGSTWIFDTVIVYGYQKGSGTASTYLNCNFQIYSGTPGLGGIVIWGDTSTNVLISSGFTGIYRVDTIPADGGLTSVERPIMYLKLYLSPAPNLSAGTYWLSWSSAGSLSASGSPSKVLAGRINPTGQQARQLYEGTWNYTVDNGHDVGMDKIIKAKEGLESVLNVQYQTTSILNPNTPNPFSNTTDISYYLSGSGYTNLSVYNTLGELVKTLIDGDMNSGMHHVTFNAGDLPAGAYYYRLSTNTFTRSRQMTLIK